MENRVFYRVRASEGDAAASARFAVHSSKGPLAETNTETGVGSFLMTPDPKETYTLKIASPMPCGTKASCCAARPYSKSTSRSD